MTRLSRHWTLARRGGRRRAPSTGLRLNTQLVVSLLSKVLWVGRTLLVRNAATQKKRVFTSCFLPPCIARMVSGDNRVGDEVRMLSLPVIA